MKSFCKKAIAVTKSNIVHQKDIERWPDVNSVQIPHLNAAIGLLIGTNVLETMEPEKRKVIESMNGHKWITTNLDKT